MLLLANSLIDGFLKSNGVGQGIVVLQVLGSIAMVAAIFGKWQELSHVTRTTRRFLRDFANGTDVLEYYLKRRPTATTGLECIYRLTSEKLLKLLTPDVRSLVGAHRQDGEGAEPPILSNHEIDLVRSTCEHALDEEVLRVEHGMGLILTVISIAPMLGLLGTVWGVLDAFYEMGTAGSANLATIAPSISSALVTTVVGLLVALPGIVAHSLLTAMVKNVTADMEGFAAELMVRVGRDYEGRDL